MILMSRLSHVNSSIILSAGNVLQRGQVEFILPGSDEGSGKKHIASLDSIFTIYPVDDFQ